MLSPEKKAIAYMYSGRQTVGIVTFIQKNFGKTEIKVDLFNIFPTGAHGFHVHESGDMTRGCESMGAHYNPLNSTHGGRFGENRHLGDFGNVYSDDYGVVKETFFASINLADIINRGLVIHKNWDDEGHGNNPESKKTGNSGERIACGVIQSVE